MQDLGLGLQLEHDFLHLRAHGGSNAGRMARLTTSPFLSERVAWMDLKFVPPMSIA